MKRASTIAVLLLLSIASAASAAAPDLLPPLSMQVSPDTQITATGLDFFDHAKSGTVNFNPSNYDVHLPGNVVLPVQDVIPYAGVRPPFADCNDFATMIYDYFNDVFGSLKTFMTNIGVPLPAGSTQDINVIFTAMKQLCNTAGMQQALGAASVAQQNLADVRNTAAGSTDVVFSGEPVNPYSAGFPPGSGRTGVVVGESGSGKDVWTDGVVVTTADPIVVPSIGEPTWTSSLFYYRFLPNPAGKVALQFSGISTAWIDRPPLDNPNCFDVSNPKNPQVFPVATLIKNGCVGEHFPSGIVALNFFNHADSKMKDLVVVSRGIFGLDNDPKAKIGFLTTYKRDEKLPAPSDTSTFQDIWKFDHSVTNSTYGIPESYGLTTIKSWDAKANAFVEGVVAASNKLQGARYFDYYYVNNGTMKEPLPFIVGSIMDKKFPGFGGFGPYRVYSADINGDRCGDIINTHANIDPKGTSIQFADYFVVHLQKTGANGACLGVFEDMGTMYHSPLVDPNDPNRKPQIASLAIADFNKDGRLDVLAGDFTTYVDKTAVQQRVNYLNFFEGVSGGLLAPVPTRIIATTKTHGDDIGIIDVKADAFANIGAATGIPAMYPPVTSKPTPNPCIDPVTGQLKGVCMVCRPGNDADKDGIWDMPAPTIIDNNGNSVPFTTPIDTCAPDANGTLVPKTVDMPVNDTLFNFYDPNDSCKDYGKKSGREWIHEWANCDNCSPGAGEACLGAEDNDQAKNKCYNPSQKDDDQNGYGNVCGPKSTTCGNHALNMPGITYDPAWLTVMVDANKGITNDVDGDGIPDCVVYKVNGVDTTGGCKSACDNCSPYNTPKNADCKTDSSKCYNPDQKDTDGDNYGDACTAPPPFPVNDPCFMNPAGPNCKPIGPQQIDPCIQNPNMPGCPGFGPPKYPKNEPKIHEDKVIYADDQPVLAYKHDLKLTGGAPAFVDNGHEVVVILNKSVVKDVVVKCANGDLNCICAQTPDNPLCKCKDPKSPDCPVNSGVPACTMDVCRGDLTAPFPKTCDYIRPYNDKFREITGLTIDPFVPVEGAQYHVYCAMPNTPALDLGSGAAYSQIYKTGQLPKNYFKQSLKPVADDNVLAKAVLLNPPDSSLNGGVALDVSSLPKVDADLLLDVVPTATLTQAPGIAQVDGIMQIETNMVDPATLGLPAVSKQAANAGGAGAAAAKVLTVDIKGFSSPPGCQWTSSDCPKPMRNQISPVQVLAAAQVMVDQYKAAGKPITQDILADIYKSMPDVGPAFLHQEFIIPGAKGNVVIPIQNTMGNMSAEGGCGCTIGAPSTTHNTVVPLLMSALAFLSMTILRRQTAKKR